jgi:hypothetical protein
MKNEGPLPAKESKRGRGINESKMGAKTCVREYKGAPCLIRNRTSLGWEEPQPKREHAPRGGRNHNRREHVERRGCGKECRSSSTMSAEASLSSRKAGGWVIERKRRKAERRDQASWKRTREALTCLPEKKSRSPNRPSTNHLSNYE